jgi:hypothetical protein
VRNAIAHDIQVNSGLSSCVTVCTSVIKDICSFDTEVKENEVEGLRRPQSQQSAKITSDMLHCESPRCGETAAIQQAKIPSNRDRTSDLGIAVFPLQSHALPTELSKAIPSTSKIII